MFFNPKAATWNSCVRCRQKKLVWPVISAATMTAPTALPLYTIVDPETVLVCQPCYEPYYAEARERVATHE